MDRDYDESLLNSNQMQKNNLYPETKPNNNRSRISEQKYNKVLLTKTPELAISISLLLFSILFYFLVRLQHHSNAYLTCNFSTFILLSQALDKNNMFLLCNFILVFLVGYRHFATSSPSSTSYALLEDCADETLPHHNYDQVQAILIPHNEHLSVDEGEHDIRYENRGREQEEEVNKEEESKRDVMLVKDIYEVRGESRREEVYDVPVDKEIAVDESRKEDTGSYECEYNNLIAEGEHGGGLLVSGRITDTDELNNKFEEFIRKMKQELKLEVHKQQLVTA